MGRGSFGGPAPFCFFTLSREIQLALIEAILKLAMAVAALAAAIAALASLGSKIYNDFKEETA